MKELVENFTKQLEEALQIGKKVQLTKASQVKNIVITGLGGSGIGGTLVAEFFAAESPLPIVVNKDYFLPGFVSNDSLVIVSSYSGNTEETLQAMQIAADKGAKIVCVTSGGKILELAKKYKYDFIEVPGGMPPRACLAYTLVQLMFVLKFNRIIETNFESQIESSIGLLDKEEDNIVAQAAAVAEKLNGKTPVIYTPTGYEGVAIRLRQQINENSKTLCWHHIIPEMNHNELVGWAHPYKDLAVIMLKTDDTYNRNAHRQNISKEVISKYASSYTELTAKGNSHIERALYLIHLGDWISCFLADLNKVDAVEVRVIDYLKSSLNKI